MIKFLLPVGGRGGVRTEGKDVGLAESSPSADLGGSSNDSGEMPEHQSGERFQSNGNRL